MTVQEAVRLLLTRHLYYCQDYDEAGMLLVPIIERALRAAYHTGVRDHIADHYGLDTHSDKGVTAGVKAMMEES